MSDLPPLPPTEENHVSVTPSTPPATVVSNPLTWLFDFLGSANVQKAVGVVGGPVAAVQFHTWTAKLATMGAGALFALAVHGFDALRAKIEASKAAGKTTL